MLPSSWVKWEWEESRREQKKPLELCQIDKNRIIKSHAGASLHEGGSLRETGSTHFPYTRIVRENRRQDFHNCHLMAAVGQLNRAWPTFWPGAHNCYDFFEATREAAKEFPIECTIERIRGSEGCHIIFCDFLYTVSVFAGNFEAPK